MRSGRVWFRSSRMWMRSSKQWMRSSRMVKASDCQCRSSISPAFDPSILRHSGIWRVADKAVLNIVHKTIGQSRFNIWRKNSVGDYLDCWLGQSDYGNFEKLASKFKKVLIWPKHIWGWYQNNAEFYAESETVEKNAKIQQLLYTNM